MPEPFLRSPYPWGRASAAVDEHASRAVDPSALLMIPTLLCLALLQAPPAATDNPDPAGRRPKVGEALPAFSLEDQHGASRNFASLTGPKGLVLVFFRSADC